MTQFLPPNLLALFAPRDPAPFFPPLDELPWEKKPWPYTGVSQYLNLFEDPSETPAPTRGETKEERVSRKQKEKDERHRENLKMHLDSWNPSGDAEIQGDPFKTIFVGRINYDTSESKLRRELEVYGPVKRIALVQYNGKPRGYAFVEYEKERDMHSAYKYADGKKIDGRRIVVDVERGRTVKSWKPRRLGGGLGGTRRGGPQENIKYSGRVDERDNGHAEDRDRDRDERDRDRERERDRRDRERDRDRRKRSRSRDRDRDRDRDRERRKRSRSRDRDRGEKKKRDRSRSRERDRKDRDRKDRDRDRDKDKSNHRSHDRKREREEEPGMADKRVKTEA